MVLSSFKTPETIPLQPISLNLSISRFINSNSSLEYTKSPSLGLINTNTDDFEISSKDIEGWLVANEGSITVALDINVDDKLKEEGIARELVSKIQNLRKSKGFEVTDRINLIFNGDEKIKNAINNNLEYVKTETLSSTIKFDIAAESGLDVIFDKLKTKIFITKV